MRLISGFLGGRELKTASGKGYRPAMGKVREALFSILEARGIVWEETKVLDIYAGTGSLAFEAISRGAIQSTFIELSADAYKCLVHNGVQLGIESQCKFLKEDAIKFIQKPATEAFSLVFIDPPYGEEKLQPTLKYLVQNNWLAPHAFVIAEIEYRLKVQTEADNLQLLTDRTYGQTRILLWEKNDIYE